MTEQLQGLINQVTECIYNAYNKGLKEGRKQGDEERYNEGYSKGYADGVKNESERYENPIRVGDIVKTMSDERGIVTQIENELAYILWIDGLKSGNMGCLPSCVLE